MTSIPPCPACNSPYTYEMDTKLVCPECAFEWTHEVEQEPAGLVVKDANGNILAYGDAVVVIKDLPVKGAPKPIKAGTKVSAALFSFTVNLLLIHSLCSLR
jgi:protein PhnA